MKMILVAVLAATLVGLPAPGAGSAPGEPVGRATTKVLKQELRRDAARIKKYVKRAAGFLPLRTEGNALVKDGPRGVRTKYFDSSGGTFCLMGSRTGARRKWFYDSRKDGFLPARTKKQARQGDSACGEIFTRDWLLGLRAPVEADALGLAAALEEHRESTGVLPADVDAFVRAGGHRFSAGVGVSHYATYDDHFLFCVSHRAGPWVTYLSENRRITKRGLTDRACEIYL